MSDRYLVLLRGVNVGGNKKVPKKELQAVLESIGFTDVTVYINSGNAVGTHTGLVAADEVQSALTAHFGFEVPTLVLPSAKVRAIAAAIPEHWTNDSPNPEKTGYQSNVAYLFDDVNTPDVLEMLGHDPAIENMIYVDGAVIQSISRANQARGALAKVIGRKLYAHMTVRNVNTARKLAELLDL